MKQKTKIIATIGPATQNLKTMTKLARAGMSFARLNMSHGDHDTHKKTIDLRNEVEKNEKIFLGVIADLCGPKIRIGDFINGEITLKKGQKFQLTTEKVAGTEKKVYINYKKLTKDIPVGTILLLNDGKNSLEVTKKINDKTLETKVLIGGTIKSRRGVNIPGANLSISALTAKDKKDITWGVAQNCDYFAISFVRSHKDVLLLRKILTEHKSSARIIAKIETPEAVENIDAIIEASDAIMVARGDLAIEVGAAQVPYIQKQVIKKCNDVGKPVITATQMLESMVRNSIPTRAEVSDVANAICDGTDAVMLSEETAIGAYPVKAVEMMARTAQKTEATFTTHRRIKVAKDNLVDSVSASVVHVAEDVAVKYIVALTESGGTARMISRYRPKEPIIAITPHTHCARQLLLSYGVHPIKTSSYTGVTSATKGIREELLKRKLVKKKDRIILSAGFPFGEPGSTNMLMMVTI